MTSWNTCCCWAIHLCTFSALQVAILERTRAHELELDFSSWRS